jgi:hypothetical protein
VKNYFNYFTEIEERFQQRRGSLLLLSTLDWALIETWREAGFPLEAVLRGIDDAFDKHDARRTRGRIRRINGLAWCMQAVMSAAESMQEATVGSNPAGARSDPPPGFEPVRIAAYLNDCSAKLEAVFGEAKMEGLAKTTAAEVAHRLQELAAETMVSTPKLEELELRLTVLEEKLFTTIKATTGELEMIALREESARELAPYRSRMKTEQIRLVEEQFLDKRLLEKHGLPRLSLFYMS